MVGTQRIGEVWKRSPNLNRYNNIAYLSLSQISEMTVPYIICENLFYNIFIHSVNPSEMLTISLLLVVTRNIQMQMSIANKEFLVWQPIREFKCLLPNPLTLVNLQLCLTSYPFLGRWWMYLLMFYMLEDRLRIYQRGAFSFLYK